MRNNFLSNALTLGRKALASAAVFFALSSFAFAAASTPQTIQDIMMGFAKSNGQYLLPIYILVGLITFLAGVLRFVGAGDNEEARQAGRDVMVYGIIILFVMISFWGFVAILTNSFFGKDPVLPNYLPTLMKN